MPTTYVPKFDLQTAFPELVKRLCVRLHPTPAVGLAPSASKIGGVFLWSSTQTIPTCREHLQAMVPLLQIRQSETFGLIAFPERCDLLQAWWCPQDHERFSFGPSVHIVWWSHEELDATTQHAAEPEDRNDDYIPTECAVFPECVWELPSAAALEPGLLERVDQWIKENVAEEGASLGIAFDDLSYQYYFSSAPGTKLSGYPNWIQGPVLPKCSCSLSMELLLTVASTEGDGWKRWLPVERRDPKARSLAQDGAGLMIGDVGSVFVFSCPKCGTDSLAEIAQCS